MTTNNSPSALVFDYALNRPASLFGRYRRVRNESNLDPFYSFKQNSFSCGVNLQF